MAEAALQTPPTVPNSSPSGEAVHARPTPGALEQFQTPQTPPTTPAQPYNPYSDDDAYDSNHATTPPKIGDDSNNANEEAASTPPTVNNTPAQAIQNNSAPQQQTQTDPQTRAEIEQRLTEIEQNLQSLNQQFNANQEEINALREQIEKSQFKFFIPLLSLAIFSDFLNIIELFISFGLLAPLTNGISYIILRLVRQPENVQKYFDESATGMLVVEIVPIVSAIPYFSWKIVKIKYKSEQDLSGAKDFLKKTEKERAQITQAQNQLIQYGNQLIQYL